MSAAVVEHRSPTGRGRGHAESQKAHGGFCENCSRHADGGLHDHRLNNIWQDMADDNSQIACAEGAGGFDEFALTRGEDLSAHQTRVANPASERESENKIEDAGTTECDERNGQQNSRERQERIHEDDIDEAVDASSVITGNGADDEAEDKRSEYDAAPDEHGNASTEDDAGENVAAEFVGAEPVRAGWRVESCGEIDGGGILRRDPGSEEREDYKDDDEHDAGCGQRIMARISGDPTTQRDG